MIVIKMEYNLSRSLLQYQESVFDTSTNIETKNIIAGRDKELDLNRNP